MKKHLFTLSFSLLAPLSFADQPLPPNLGITLESARYLTVLPAEHTVLNALTALPEVRSAREGIALSEAERARLESGPYEWRIGGETAKRRVSGDSRYNEYTVTLERPVRWMGKASKDAELGAKALELSKASYEETLHEAGRTLLTDWFIYLREHHAMQRLDEQTRLYNRLLDASRQLLQRGDIPRLEVLLAETEYERLRVTHLQAQQRVTQQRIKLEKHYTGLQATLPYTTLAPLPPRIDSPEQWITLLLSDNHAINEAQLATAKARVDLERRTLEKKPDPTLSLRYSSERSNEEKVVGVAISIPLPGEGRHADQASAAAQLNMTHENERKVRTLAEQEAAGLIAHFNDSQRIATTLSQIARQTHEAAALVSKAYLLGESPFSDTLLATRQALEAQQAAEEAHLNTLELYARVLLDTHQIWMQTQPADRLNSTDDPAGETPAQTDLFQRPLAKTLTP